MDYTLFRFLSITNTTKEYTDSVLQSIIPLYYYTLEGTLFHLGGNIRNLNYLKMQTVVLDIAITCGDYIIEEVSRVIDCLMGVHSMGISLLRGHETGLPNNHNHIPL